MPKRREKELRCFCSGEPLLATFGIGSRGQLYVHVKIWKQKRIYGELTFEGGVVKIRCRNCFRWHRVIFSKGTASLSEDKTPEVPAVSP